MILQKDPTLPSNRDQFLGVSPGPGPEACGPLQASQQPAQLWQQRPRIPLAPACSTVPYRQGHCGAAAARSHSSGKTRAEEA